MSHATAYLRKISLNGLTQRHPRALQQMERELQCEHFVLTVYDIVTLARSQGSLCQRRGSAANLAVCYALGINGARANACA